MYVLTIPVFFLHVQSHNRVLHSCVSFVNYMLYTILYFIWYTFVDYICVFDRVYIRGLYSCVSPCIHSWIIFV